VIIALVGMSGVGKSTWAARFHAAGYRHVDCDALIAGELARQYQQSFTDLGAVGGWMGMPDAPQFAAREQAYLAAEAHVLAAALATLDRQPTVIDCTGSVVYLPAGLLQRLRQHASIMHLAEGAASAQRRIAGYLAAPRPIVWAGAYQPQPGETRDQSIARCFAELVAWRVTRYRALCHHTIDEALHRDPACGVAGLLRQLAGAPAGRS
jgi:shikimate kinase